MRVARQRVSGFATQPFIGNKFVESSSPGRIRLLNPCDDSVVVEDVQVAGKAEVDAAVSAAIAAFHGPWGKFTPAERQACLLRFASLVEKNAENLATLESLPTGRPITPILQFDVAHMVQVFRYYAGWTDKIAGESYAADNGFYKIVQYEPLGVCAGIASWNSTFLYVGWKIAPALAAGNCVFIFKASEKSPLGALALGPLFAEAGFPAGVVQLLTGGQETGELLAGHMGISKISFTGSVSAGRAVQEMAVKTNLKRVTLELGGKSPAIVFDDADFESAVQNVAGFLANSGQICVATSRVLVQKTIATAFCDRLASIFKSAEDALGSDPLDASTCWGPVVDRSQYDRIMSYIAIGKETATLVTGGERKGSKGCFIKPTIFLNPDPQSRIVKEEIFGPVMVIQVFDTEAEAIQMANDTDYGLAACVYTESVDRALRVSGRLNCGGVSINSPFLPELNTPFGGTKTSGQGRELGKHGLMEYLEPKSIHIKLR